MVLGDDTINYYFDVVHNYNSQLIHMDVQELWVFEDKL